MWVATEIDREELENYISVTYASDDDKLLLKAHNRRRKSNVYHTKTPG